MSITGFVLRFAAPLPRLMDYERYLFLGPHPDDIEIGAGATAARLAAAGKQVTFLICTDGRYGLEHAPAGTTPEALIEIRKAEAIASAKMLGVEDVRFLGLCDGGFYDPDAMLEGVARVIGQTRAQVIFAPDPDVKSECHVDHRRVGECARRLAYLAPYARIMSHYGAEAAPVDALAYYMTARPNRYVKTQGLLARQCEAVFRCHKSQFPPGCADARSIVLYLRLRSADFGLRSASAGAEGFRVLGRTQMHCLPEAGE